MTVTVCKFSSDSMGGTLDFLTASIMRSRNVEASIISFVHVRA